MEKILKNISLKIQEKIGNNWFIFLFSFSAVTVFNLDRILDPPYWDAIMGVYSQGVWLLENGFNFLKLYNQPDYFQGGPKIHFFFVLAPIFGILSKSFPPHLVFLILHLFNFVCAALTLTIFFMLMRIHFGKPVAFIWVLAGAFNPIWSGQTAAIYLEVPFAAVASVSLYYFWKNQYGLASLFCFLSYFIKNSSLLLGTTYFVLGVFLLGKYFFQGRKKGNRFPRPMLFLFIPLVLMRLLHKLDSSYFSVFADFFGYLVYFFVKARFLYPDVAFQLVLVLMLFVFNLVMILKSKSITDQWNKVPLFVWLLLIYVGGFWLSFIIYAMPLPRYISYIVFPLIFLLAFFLQFSRKISLMVGFVFLVFGILNQNSGLLPSLPADRARSGHLLERSREYLLDLDGNRELCRHLEKNHFNDPIVAKYPYTQMLTLPELGYVSKSLPNIIEAGRYSSITKSVPLNRVREALVSIKTLCIYSPNINENNWGPSLKPQPEDKILYLEEKLKVPVVVFIRQWS